MRVLVVHHVQVILICLHISQQIIRRDIAALCLLVVCAPREREISSSQHCIHPSVSCPSMPGCARATQLRSPPQSHSWCPQPPLSLSPKVMGENCPSAAPWGSVSFTFLAHPATPIHRKNAPVYPLPTAEQGRAVGLGLCPPRNVTLIVDQGGGGIHEDVFCAAFSFAAVQPGLAAQPSRDIFQVKAGEKRQIEQSEEYKVSISASKQPGYRCPVAI